MANTRRWIISTSDANQLVINQSYPLQLLQTTPLELLNALRINAQGSAVKAYESGLMPAAGASVTVDLGAVRCFGVRVRITDSPLNFKFGQYTIQIRDGATVLGQAVLMGNRVPAEVIILGISNNGGQATAQTIANPQVVIQGSASGSSTVSSSTAYWAETLNLRDLGVIG